MLHIYKRVMGDYCSVVFFFKKEETQNKFEQDKIQSLGCSHDYPRGRR